MVKQLELTRLLIKLNSDIKRVTSSRSSIVFVLCVKRWVCTVCTEYTLWRIREICILFNTKYIVCTECTIFTLCTRRISQVLSPAYFPISYDQIESVVRKICLFVSNCKSCFLLLLKGGMQVDARDFINIEMRGSKYLFYLQCKSEENWHNSDRYIRGTSTIVFHRLKLGGTV